MVMVDRLYKARHKKTKNLIRELERIIIEQNLTKELVAHECKVRENTVHRWLLSLTKSKHSIKTMHPGTMVWVEAFIDKHSQKNDKSLDSEKTVKALS